MAFVVPLVAPTRMAGVFAPPFAGLAGTGAGERALDIEAAVGLLRRSAALLLKVTFFVGVGSCGWAFRALASDAAVGADKPEGVFGRLDDGVLGREGVLELVLA